MKIKSAAFKNGDRIPVRYTCDGANIHPPLAYSGVPKNAKNLILLVEDVDSYAGVWVHWVAWNIDPHGSMIPEGELPSGVKESRNSFGDIGYGGPCPHKGRHRYYFRLYALDGRFKIPRARGMTWADLELEMVGHIIDRAETMGYYERPLRTAK